MIRFARSLSAATWLFRLPVQQPSSMPRRLLGRFSLCLLCLVLTGRLASSQDKTSPPEKKSAISSPSQWLDKDAKGIEALDAYIEQARQAWDVPGLAVAIVHKDQVLLSKGYGVKRVGGSDGVDRHTLFAIASNSKAYTAAAIAMLVEEGKLQWDDRVQQYLPWLQLNEPFASYDLRVRDLLCHRSGLGTFSGDLLWFGTPYTPREVLERAKHLKFESPFRTQFGYSNLMFLAAGELIEKVSGKTWSQFIKERIFEPLEMERSITSVRDLVVQDNYATPHKTFLDRSQPLAWENWDCMAAAGGIISSADDMSRWLRLQLRQGKLNDTKVLFSEANAREMWEAHTPLKVSARASQRTPSTHFKAYGLGWSLSDYGGRKLVAHGGGYDGMYSQVIMCPDEQLGIVVLTNSMTGIAEPIAMQIVDHFLGDAIAAKKDWAAEALPGFRRSRQAFDKRIELATTAAAEGTKPSHPTAAYTGSFVCPMYGEVKIEMEGEKLVLRMIPNPVLVADLEHLHYDTFVLRWRNEVAWFGAGTVHFVADARGVFTELKLDVPNDDLWFHELKPVRVK